MVNLVLRPNAYNGFTSSGQSVPYPGATTGPTAPTTFGDLFPSKSGPFTEDGQSFLDNYFSGTPELDPSQPDTPEFNESLKGHARRYSNWQDVNEIPDGKYLHILIYQQPRGQKPIPPSTFGCALWTSGGDLELTYDYWWQTPPRFELYAFTTPECGDDFPNEQETINFYGATPPFIGTYGGPSYWRGGVYYCEEWSDTEDGGDPQPAMPIPAPEAPVIPSAIPAPPVPLRAPPPVILTGSVTMVDPPDPPAVTVTNNLDGTVTMDYEFVCCPGPEGPPGEAAEQPTFTIGTVEVVPIEDAYVTISGGPIAFVFDFGIPSGGTAILEPLSIPLSLINELTGEPEIIDTVMYAVSDGTHTQASFISAVFNQFAQIRTKAPVFEAFGPMSTLVDSD